MTTVNKRQRGRTCLTVDVGADGVALHGDAQQLVDARNGNPTELRSIQATVGVLIQQFAAVIVLNGMKRANLGMGIPSVRGSDQLIDANIVADFFQTFPKQKFYPI